MSEGQTCYCRNCAYELTALSDAERCPECGGRQHVDSLRKVRVRSPWWVRLWPMYFGVLSASPILISSGRHWISDGYEAVVFGTTFTLSFWLPPFVLLTALGWTRHVIPHSGVRVAGQLAGVVAVVLFPGITIIDELLNPTDAQSAFVLFIMPILGPISGAIAASIGAALAWTHVR